MNSCPNNPTILLLLLLLLLLLFHKFSFLHWQTLYWVYNVLPIKRVITNDQRFIDFLSISYVFKNLLFPILLDSFSPVQFLEQFPSPSPFVAF